MSAPTEQDREAILKKCGESAVKLLDEASDDEKWFLAFLLLNGGTILTNSFCKDAAVVHAAALQAERERTRAEDDEDFIKLVRTDSMINRLENVAKAIIEDVEYGAHRAGRLYVLEQVAASAAPACETETEGQLSEGDVAIEKLRAWTDPNAVLNPPIGICVACGQRESYTYHVPEAQWRRFIPEQWWNEIVCAECFHRFAATAPTNNCEQDGEKQQS